MGHTKNIVLKLSSVSDATARGIKRAHDRGLKLCYKGLYYDVQRVKNDVATLRCCCPPLGPEDFVKQGVVVHRKSFNGGRTYWHYTTLEQLKDIKAHLAHVDAAPAAPSARHIINATLKAEAALVATRKARATA